MGHWQRVDQFMFAVVNHLHLSISLEQLRLPLQAEALPQVQPGFLGAHVVKEAEAQAIVSSGIRGW